MLKSINIIINGKSVTVPAGTTILEAARIADMNIPTLFYLKGIVDTDESGVCVVEVAGRDNLIPAASTLAEEGMEITTESPRLTDARKDALKKILEIHDYDCTYCDKIDSCELKPLLRQYFVTDEPCLAKSACVPYDISSDVFVRNENRCIRCRRCVNVCTQVQGVAAISAEGEGLQAKIGPFTGAYVTAMGMGSTNCVNCGQCVAVCPTGALLPKENIDEVKAALADPNKFVVAQVAPAVRAALGEYFEFPIGVDVEGKIPAALREIGFDKVFDTKLGADLTIMEEAQEFIDRFKNGGTLPMMTSCCPGWVKYAETFYPELLDHLSTCKSPHQMLGTVVKTYVAEKMEIAKENIVVVSVMPCTAKKYESKREELSGDVDVVITTTELGKLIEDYEVPFEALPNEAFDEPLGTGSGAAVIFGATGGVMEAALRTAAEWLTGKAAEQIDFVSVRGTEGVKEAAYEIGGTEVRVAVVSGLEQAKALLDKVELGEAEYHFIEVMACPGGCVNGGGQPHQSEAVQAMISVPAERGAALYRNDANSAVRKSHENLEIKELYGSYLGEPGSERAHQLLHTTYVSR